MNNVVPIAKALSSEELAAAWVARIDAGRLTRKDREALLSWLAADPLHPALLDEHARAWAFAGSGRTPVIVPTRDLPRRRILAMAVAASVAVAIGHEVVHKRSVFESDYATVIGENKRIALPDGSLIKLNTATRLSVVFTRDRRRITLLAGEGLFEVAHDASRPFEVFAAGFVTRAIGTRFFVREAVVAACVRGRDRGPGRAWFGSRTRSNDVRHRPHAGVRRGTSIGGPNDIGDQSVGATRCRARHGMGVRRHCVSRRIPVGRADRGEPLFAVTDQRC